MAALAKLFTLALSGHAATAAQLQNELNGVGSGTPPIVDVFAGFGLEQLAAGNQPILDAFGNPVINAENLSAGTLTMTSDGRNIDASGSGVIGAGTVGLNASGDIAGNIFTLGNVSLNANNNITGSVLGLGTVNVASAGGSVSGTFIGVGGVSASGGSVDANLESNASISGNTSGEKGFASGTAANATSQGMSSDNPAAATAKNSDDSTADEKKKKKISLAQKVSRVTVLLPGKN
jgi:hypothetical protein